MSEENSRQFEQLLQTYTQYVYFKTFELDTEKYAPVQISEIYCNKKFVREILSRKYNREGFLGIQVYLINFKEAGRKILFAFYDRKHKIDEVSLIDLIFKRKNVSEVQIRKVDSLDSQMNLLN